MKHTTLSVVVLVLFTTLLSCSKSEHTNTSPDSALPNIILLVGDDQGYPYFGFTGADYIQTPNMDSLAASGIVFDQGYVSDNHCRPSLQTLLTSLLPIDFNKQNFAYMDKAIEEQGIPLDSAFAYKQKFDRMALGFNQFETLPKLLAQKGYASFQGGKWWEFNYQNGGFTHGMTKGWTEEEQKTAGWFLKHMGGEGMDLARVTNQPAYDFLEETKGQPFFMWFAPSLPHYPFDAPAKYYDIYKDQDMSESAKQYYANCTWFDDAWGQLVEYLKAHKLYENTLIVYVNDNGWEQEPKAEYWDDPQRSHNGGDKGKGSIYDLSFKTPIIFSFPNQIENSQRSDLLIHSADIPATILDYAGIEIPESFYGQSFKSIIEGDSNTGRPYIVGNVVTSRSTDPSDVMGRHIEGYWVRKDNWFLRWHATDEEIELFDVQKDPFNNIDLSKQFPEIRDELKEIAMTYKAAHGADPRLAYYLEMSGK
jgi:arylsulfatase A-like enzyme